MTGLQLFLGLRRRFYFRACAGQGWGRGGAGVARVTFPSSGTGFGCPVRGAFGWFSGVCWGSVGYNWDQSVWKGKIKVLQLFLGLWRRFFFGSCARACWGRGGAGVAQVTFPPSGAGLGCLVPGLLGWVSGVCWGFVGQNWHQGV